MVKESAVKQGECTNQKTLENKRWPLLSSFTVTRKKTFLILLSLFHPYIHTQHAYARTRGPMCGRGWVGVKERRKFMVPSGRNPFRPPAGTAAKVSRVCFVRPQPIFTGGVS